MDYSRMISAATALSLCLVLALCMAVPAAMAGDAAPRMETDTLAEQIDDPNIVIVDVRGMKYVKEEGGQKIKGAVLLEPDNADAWIAKQTQGQTFVLYCS